MQIAVIHPGALGDLVLALPLAQSLAEQGGQVTLFAAGGRAEFLAGRSAVSVGRSLEDPALTRLFARGGGGTRSIASAGPGGTRFIASGGPGGTRFIASGGLDEAGHDEAWPCGGFDRVLSGVGDEGFNANLSAALPGARVERLEVRPEAIARSGLHASEFLHRQAFGPDAAAPLPRLVPTEDDRARAAAILAAAGLVGGQGRGPSGGQAMPGADSVHENPLPSRGEGRVRDESHGFGGDRPSPQPLSLPGRGAFRTCSATPSSQRRGENSKTPDRPLPQRSGRLSGGSVPPSTQTSIKQPAVPADKSRTLLVHPGSGGRAKCWALDGFIAVGEALSADGWRVVFVPGEAEIERMAASDRGALTERFAVLTAPSLGELAGLIASSDAWLGNDSGPTHVAAAIGAATVALFGPTDPQVWGPRGRRVEILRGDPSAGPDWGLRPADVAGRLARISQPTV